ncbi:uncharacterized protein [Aquarana catesbeiana]|uniref:uncharacterized protein isoform X2 n=1 Tax=Aquarana catesbeiana TaxID=8400 RepID=UPI003CC9401D
MEALSSSDNLCRLQLLIHRAAGGSSASSPQASTIFPEARWSASKHRPPQPALAEPTLRVADSPSSTVLSTSMERSADRDQDEERRSTNHRQCPARLPQRQQGRALNKSSKPTTPVKTKKQIISKHLRKMNKKRMEMFKKAVCRMKFPPGAGPITMEQLRDKSPEQIVTFIFRCHTEIHGTATIIKALQSISENQIRLSIGRDIRNGNSHNTGKKANKKGGSRSIKGKPKQAITALKELVKNPIMFFKEVEARPALYNKNSQDTCNRKMKKKKLWEKVASKVIKNWKKLNSKSKEEIISSVPKKWRNFADTFRREFNKQMKERESGSTSSTRTKYCYYEVLRFLLPTMQQRQTSSNRLIDCEQDDVQQDSINQDEGRPKEKQAAAKTKKSKQGDLKGLQTVSERFSQGSSQSRKSLPNTRMEKEISNIMATHLKILGEDIGGFQYFLCLIERFRGSKILMKDIKGKSVKEMVDLIISRHTMEHAQATVNEVLDRMGKTEIKMLIVEDISKSLAFTSLPMKKQDKVAKNLKKLPVGKWRQFKMNLCNMKPPGEAEEITMENLNNKLRKQVVELIFKCYNEKLGREKILGILKDLKEPKIRSKIQRIFREGSSQSGKYLPNISMKKRTSKIMTTHLEKLGDEDIVGFQYFLCSIEKPFIGSKIQMKDIKDKSVKEMVNLIISRHTMEHAQATVKEVLDRMGKTEIKMLIVEDIRKISATTSLNMKNQAIITKYLKELSAAKWKKFKTALCNMKPPGEAEEITMENLNGKHKWRVVELIFRCYNEKLGTEKILEILKILKEPKIRSKMQRMLREGDAKKKRKQGRDVPGKSHNIEQIADTMGGPSSAQEQPKQGHDLHNLEE